VRNMATVGGGLAHADPNQDPPPTLIALGASIKATSSNGSRVIPLDGFFTDYYETVLNPDEIITELFIPKVAPNSGAAYIKFLPRTADDYATVSAAAVLTLDKTNKNIADVPSRLVVSATRRSAPRRRKRSCAAIHFEPKPSPKPAKRPRKQSIRSVIFAARRGTRKTWPVFLCAVPWKERWPIFDSRQKPKPHPSQPRKKLRRKVKDVEIFSDCANPGRP